MGRKFAKHNERRTNNVEFHIHHAQILETEMLDRFDQKKSATGKRYHYNVLAIVRP